MADNEIAMCYFSHDNHFLLVARRTSAGLEQLCMYEASKGQEVRKSADGAKGGTKEVKQEKEGKKNEKPKGTREKTPRDKDNESNKQNKKAKGGKGQKSSEKNEYEKKDDENKQNKDNDVEGGATETDDDFGPSLEQQYLDMLAEEDDIFGPPKQFNLKEETD